MDNKKDIEEIVHLRNEASLDIDDMTALVVNSTLALRLRDFSREVMEKAPGFAFTRKQARRLKELTQKTLRQYEARTISDGDLMNYIGDARMILKDEGQENGGIKVDLGKLFPSKERKARESRDNLERKYAEIQKTIQNCEEIMERAKAESVGHAKTSQVYKNNLRAYTKAKNEMLLAQKQEEQLFTALDAASKAELIKKFNDDAKKLGKDIGIAVGDQNTRDQNAAAYEVNTGKIDDLLDGAGDFGDTIFTKTESKFGDDEFDAGVADFERRKTMMEDLGDLRSEAKGNTENLEDEFDRGVSERQ